VAREISFFQPVTSMSFSNSAPQTLLMGCILGIPRRIYLETGRCTDVRGAVCVNSEVSTFLGWVLDVCPSVRFLSSNVCLAVSSAKWEGLAYFWNRWLYHQPVCSAAVGCHQMHRKEPWLQKDGLWSQVAEIEAPQTDYSPSLRGQV